MLRTPLLVAVLSLAFAAAASAQQLTPEHVKPKGPGPAPLPPAGNLPQRGPQVDPAESFREGVAALQEGADQTRRHEGATEVRLGDEQQGRHHAQAHRRSEAATRSNVRLRSAHVCRCRSARNGQ